MRAPHSLALLLILAAAHALPQQNASEGARELFYVAVAKKEALPPIRPVAVRKAASTRPSDASGVVHLGLRYNVVLVNASSGRSETVDPDREFRNGECFALDFVSNRSGYLYVLAKQSSGNWIPLLPSPEMSDESNIINPGEKVRVPSRYCFEISAPPGAETLFVLLSRDPADVSDLHDGIKGRTPPPTDAPVQIADSRLVNSAVARMSGEVLTRDLAIRKVSQPVAAGEPANSVYVVNGSAKPASKVITRIEIRHR
jgi:hypothetical protein